MDAKLRIGQFAKRTGLSVATLRFYADQSLLQPDHVDAQTGYRYYSERQIALANKIVNLRSTNLALPEIRRLLDTISDRPELISQALEQQRRALAHDLMIAKLRLAVTDLLIAAQNESGEAFLGAIRVQITTPELGYILRPCGEFEGATTTELFEAAETSVARFDARASRPPILVRSAGSVSETQVCIPVVDSAPDKLGAVEFGTYGLSLVSSHTGPYTALPELETSMRRAADKAGLELSDSTWTRYRRFGASLEGYDLPRQFLAQSSEDFVTDLETPLILSPP